MLRWLCYHKLGGICLEVNNEREEWVALILEAKNLGLTIEEVKEFIKENEKLF